MADLIALADRVESLLNVECAFCGEDDFDLPGLHYHIIRHCDVARHAVGGHGNADVAKTLRNLAAASLHNINKDQ